MKQIYRFSMLPEIEAINHSKLSEHSFAFSLII